VDSTLAVGMKTPGKEKPVNLERFGCRRDSARFQECGSRLTGSAQPGPG
jgi:hypothetical protein